MFGIFSRKKRLQHAATVSADRSEQAVASPHVSSVIVPFSAVERAAKENYAADLVTAVMDFVNAMLDQGLYKDHEIPVSARQFFHTYLYGMEVANGGHSQFIRNYRGGLDKITSDARLALAGMRAANHLAVLEQMVAWSGNTQRKRRNRLDLTAVALISLINSTIFFTRRKIPSRCLRAQWVGSPRGLNWRLSTMPNARRPSSTL